MLPTELVRIIAIVLALLGATALAVGAQLQNDAVTRGHAVHMPRFSSLNLRQLRQLIGQSHWLFGTSLLGLAVLFQLGALALAPLIVVQPLGAFALVITSVLNARIYRVRLNLLTIGAVLLTLLGVASFVTIAATVATQQVMSDALLLQVVGVLIGLLAVFGVLFALGRNNTKPLQYVMGAGVLYGFVASLAKVVLLRIYQGDYDWLTLLAVVALISAMLLGGWFVQNAYASGPPDLVIAGLTVIDPVVAVAIGIVILGEAAAANPLTILGFILSGVVSMVGVYLLSRFHPQVSSDTRVKK
jgi:hypothetical protein